MLVNFGYIRYIGFSAPKEQAPKISWVNKLSGTAYCNGLWRERHVTQGETSLVNVRGRWFSELMAKGLECLLLTLNYKAFCIGERLLPLIQPLQSKKMHGG